MTNEIPTAFLALTSSEHQLLADKLKSDKPKSDKVNADNIPEILKRGHWCCYRLVQRVPEAKPAKVPYNPKTGKPLDPSKQEEFGAYEEVLAKYQKGGYDGIGIRIEYTLVGIDIDHCISDDGTLSPVAQDIVRIMNNSYTEVSPSGEGIRILCLRPEQFAYDKTEYLEKNSQLRLEIYPGGYVTRYVTITGNALLPDGEVAERGEELRTVLDRYMRRQSAATGSTQKLYSAPGTAATSLTPEDEALMERIASSDSGEQFPTLMAGDISAYSKDHSSADMALVNILAARTEDGAQIDRIFRSSGLMREKWNECRGTETYGEKTINKALADMAPRRCRPIEASQVRLLPTQSSPPPQQAQSSAVSQGDDTATTAPDTKVADGTDKEDELLAMITSADNDIQKTSEPHRYEVQPIGTQSSINEPYIIEDLQSLLKMQIPPTQFLVQGVLPMGLAILAATPKAGKSWMALHLAICLTMGETFLGYTVRQCDVLYFALEDSFARLKSRSEQILGGKQIPPGLHLTVSAPTLAEEPGLIEYLEEYLSAEPRTKLIIIDTLQKIRGIGGGRETLYGHDYRELGMLKMFADKHRICILVVHHTRKMSDTNPYNMISGSNGVMGAADTAWVLDRPEKKEGKKTTCVHITGRDVYSDDLVLEFDPKSCIWKNLGNVDDVREKKLAASYEDNELVHTIRELVDESSDGTWSGQASDILHAGLRKGRLLSFSAQIISREISVLERLLKENDDIEHVTAKINGNGGKKHYFRKPKQAEGQQETPKSDSEEA